MISQAEITHGILEGLLMSIAQVESRFQPYALNLTGKSVRVKSKAAAKELIELALSEGQTNIDIGIMQINYRWHKKEFVSLDQMLNPASNIDYAAKLLSLLRKQEGDWFKAVRAYHSKNPKFYRIYTKKVNLAWLKMPIAKVGI